MTELMETRVLVLACRSWPPCLLRYIQNQPNSELRIYRPTFNLYTTDLMIPEVIAGVATAICLARGFCVFCSVLSTLQAAGVARKNMF